MFIYFTILAPKVVYQLLRGRSQMTSPPEGGGGLQKVTKSDKGEGGKTESDVTFTIVTL